MCINIIFLVLFQIIFIQCEASLRVHKVDNKLIEKKRQDTLEMCRLFNEKEQMTNAKVTHARRKRQAEDDGVYNANPALNRDDVVRVEEIVDKMYDDLDEQNGAQKVSYKRKNLPKISTSDVFNKNEVNARRFNFAPAFLGQADQMNMSTPIPDDYEKVIEWPKRWKHGIIPYFIDPKTYDSQLAEDTVINAFNYFETHTCIRFQRLREKPIDLKSMERVDWIYISNPNGIRQCVHSNNEKPNTGVQLVVLGYDCMALGEILHELMHVLGFPHEHTRPDRDLHITINWDNIKPGYKKYFTVSSSKTHLTQLNYDYKSIMHYHPRAFTKNGQVTIGSNLPSSAPMGQRSYLSDMDIEKVALIYNHECADRNRLYLLKTCPTVVQPEPPKAQVSINEIDDYFKDRVWSYGIINYRLRDKVDFSAEERANIASVLKHISDETCIIFEEIKSSEENSDDNAENKPNKVQKMNVFTNMTGKPKKTGDGDKLNDEQESAIDTKSIDEQENEIGSHISGSPDPERRLLQTTAVNPLFVMRRSTPPRFVNSGRMEERAIQAQRALRAGRTGWSSRRHAGSTLVLTRSDEDGCPCPKPGSGEDPKVVKIAIGCFNSVNDLLHLFVHVLGLDHQQNMHDRDSYINIAWGSLSDVIKDELKPKLPPAASAGFPYDYNSVMHYPWLEIVNGQTNIMFPVWNDGWAMGHWHGLSSIDVQKLNHIYRLECNKRTNNSKNK